VVPDRLQRLFAHLRWADDNTLAALRAALPQPPADALELYAHVLGAEHVWLARLEGRVPRLVVWPQLSLDDCAAVAAKNTAGFESVLGRMDDAALEQAVAYTNSAGQSFTSRADDILLHVALHGAYHRGQVALLLRRQGFTPATTDYIAFVRGAPAATRRP
jgi:uncharacterized damage-inducible protein DinB